MAKEDIQIYHLEKTLSGIAIFSLSDEIIPAHLNENVILPHRHDHYCCFFVENGHLNFNVDFQNLAIQPASLLLSCPGQVHQPGEAKDLTGWAMAFEAQLIDQNARLIIEQSFAKVALISLQPSEKEWFANVFRLIHSTVEDKSPSFHFQLLQTLLNAFFYKAVILFQTQENEQIRNLSLRSIEIVKTFQLLIRKHFLVLKKPADYASKMNITVSYLNDTVKSVTGFSTTYFIQQEVFREAQRLLFYTAKSVKEIAYQLGYDDYKYFIRLFRKIAGTSPAHFRKATNQP
ncbi:AraC family transcriptional regulator [Larkinella insperata]|uniref:AraC family transcriptional regulator n=1 Tax=Larkinella insperata TaxID=332158 RepID=A0ABW3Q9C9_9BACT|nr:helix-turn-helix transcriptional regulator [Larkinella insperata]